MNIERRLHHAARELREVPITVPPLGRRRAGGGGGSGGGATRILQALAAPLLFVAGGLFAIGAMQGTPVEPIQTDIVGTPTVVVDPVGDPARADTAADAEAVRAASVSAPSVRVELEMIAEIVSSGQSRRVAGDPTEAETTDGEPSVEQPADQATAVGPL